MMHFAKKQAMFKHL